MDTSEEYIKMCEKAPEIQKSEQPTIGWFKEGIWYHNNDVWYQPPKDTDIVGMVLLFRQDQLQEMFILKFVDSLYRLIREFWEFAKLNSTFNSMEQLWLAFVMKEKFNKIWNGKKWRKKWNIYLTLKKI